MKGGGLDCTIRFEWPLLGIVVLYMYMHIVEERTPTKLGYLSHRFLHSFSMMNVGGCGAGVGVGVEVEVE